MFHLDLKKNDFCMKFFWKNWMKPLSVFCLEDRSGVDRFAMSGHPTHPFYKNQTPHDWEGFLIGVFFSWLLAIADWSWRNNWPKQGQFSSQCLWIQWAQSVIWHWAGRKSYSMGVGIIFHHVAWKVANAIMESEKINF